VALAIAGLVLNPWLAGYLTADDNSIDSSGAFAAILMVSTACVLGGVQLMWPWIERVSRQPRIGFVRGTLVVALVALVVAGAYWQTATYGQRHKHVTLVPSEHEHATPEQVRWTEDFYRRSLAAARKHGWFDIDKAMAQGFRVDPVNRTHYPNLQYMFDDVILDPDRPEWLVYADSPDGKVLMALMFFTRRLEDIGPTPGGPLAQWHYHPLETPRCAIEGLWTVGKPDENGVCAEGIPVTRTPEMLHVWFIDHPLGRFTEMQIIPEYWQEARFDFRRLHPIAVHFAIALFVIAALVDVAAVVARKRELHLVGWVNLMLAAIAAVAAVASGMTAETLLRPTHDAHQTLDTHKLLAFTSLGGILLLCSWRFALRGLFPQRGAYLYLALSLAGIGVISSAGYYGGEMVYTHGAAVRAIDRFARERYWRQVDEVYRHEPGVDLEGTGHGAGPQPPGRTLPADHSGHR
jgi:uncharacterized membrane protein